ncbi:mCG145308, isoform CRA_b, partial [Mus musculus]
GGDTSSSAALSGPSSLSPISPRTVEGACVGNRSPSEHSPNASATRLLCDRVGSCLHSAGENPHHSGNWTKMSRSHPTMNAKSLGSGITSALMLPASHWAVTLRVSLNLIMYVKACRARIPHEEVADGYGLVYSIWPSSACSSSRTSYT